MSDLVINLHYQIDKLDLENTTEDILFRIIQESITNAMRHGKQNALILNFEYENLLYLKIKDDGIGCKEIHYGFGLKQMQERVAIINGEVIYDGHMVF
ncbi:MAG: sensor histidine kinase [Thomasclavelia ramosa]